jgi:hypothetical protein
MPDEPPMPGRLRFVQGLAIALVAVGVASGIGLIPTLQSEWAGDLRERRLALIVLCVGCLLAGAGLLALRRLVASRFIPVLAGVVTIAAMLVLVVAVDMARAYRLLTTPNARESWEGQCYQEDALLGWALQPGASCRHVLEGNFDTVYRIDARGFRDIPHSEEPERRIFFFGDSYAFGHGVSNEDTFPSRIAAEYLDPRVQVLNAAVSGYGLVHMYGRLLQEQEEIGPGDLVVFSPISHDLARNLDDLEALVPWVFGAGPYPRFEAGELRADRIGSLGDRAWALLLSGPLTRDFFRFLRRALYSPPNVERGHEILAAAKRVVEERGARFALLFLPRVNEIKRERYMVDISSFESPDIRKYFPREKEELAKYRFPEDGHWNSKGHAVAARGVVREFVAGGWIEPRYLRSVP